MRRDAHPATDYYSIFQSTHPSGVRRRLADIDKAYDVFQSTHPSGVRHRVAGHVEHEFDFNPRTPVGCDYKSLIGMDGKNLFQSTHPSGVRQPR